MREPLRRVRSEPLADHAAERESAERESLDAEFVGEREHVGGEHGNAVVARRRFGGSVAAQVAAQNTEVREEILRLPIPKAVIGAERMDEYHDRFIIIAIEAIKLADSTGVCGWHVCLPAIILSA